MRTGVGPQAAEQALIVQQPQPECRSKSVDRSAAAWRGVARRGEAWRVRARACECVHSCTRASAVGRPRVRRGGVRAPAARERHPVLRVLRRRHVVPVRSAARRAAVATRCDGVATVLHHVASGVAARCWRLCMRSERGLSPRPPARTSVLWGTTSQHAAARCTTLEHGSRLGLSRRRGGRLRVLTVLRVVRVTVGMLGYRVRRGSTGYASARSTVMSLKMRWSYDSLRVRSD